MANSVESRPAVGPTPVVPETANAIGPDVSVVERTSVVGKPSEQVFGLRPTAVESPVLGAQPAATQAAKEVKPTSTPVK